MTLQRTTNRMAAILWVIAILVLLFDTVIYSSVTRPREIELAAMEQEYLTRRAAQSGTGEDSGGKDTALERVYGRIPKWEGFTKKIGDVYRRAEGLNLVVDSVSYQTAEIKEAGLLSIKASLPVAGSYGQLKRFIYELESSPDLFIIESISLSKGNAAEKEISLMLELKMHFKG